MVHSKAKTVAEYLASLPSDRRAALTAVRNTVLQNLDRGFEEHMSYGMIGYSVPLGAYPPGYHCNPQQALPYAGLASQKGHMSLYLFGLYCDVDDAKWFEKAWKGAGKRLDMGKCCVRFKKLEDVPLDVLGAAIQRMSLSKFLGAYEAARAGDVFRRNKGTTEAAKAAKPPARKAAKKPARKAAKKPAKKVAKKPAKKVAKAKAR